MNSSATCGTISNSKLEGLHDSTAFGQNNSATLTSSFEDNKLSSKARHLYQQHGPTADPIATQEKADLQDRRKNFVTKLDAIG